MKNKWLILVIFLVATTLFLSIDMSKVKFNGNSKDNYEYYYGEFEEKALDTTTGVIKGITNTFNTISNIFNNVWGFINNLFSDNSNIIDLKIAQGDATITSFNLIEKQQIFTAEYFKISINGDYNQVIIIGKNNLMGSVPGNLWPGLEEDANYINFDFTKDISNYNDYSITTYSVNTVFTTIISKADVFALNDIDCIIIPLANIQNNNDLLKTCKEKIVNNFDDTIANFNNLNINYWLIKNVNENETGVIGSWVKNEA